MPALVELKDRTLSQAIGPRQRGLLEPMIETRLDWAAGTIGRLAHRATVEVDDASVAERLAGLNQDAATAWHDPAHLRKLGRTAVNEPRYQGERRGWDPAETDSRVRNGLSDLYAGAVEAAIGQDDLDGAAALYDHARPVLDSERQVAIDRRFARARDDALLRDVDGALTASPLDPSAPPDAEVIAAHATELLPEDVGESVRARIGQVAEAVYRYLDRQWNRQQASAGLAALDWFRKNPEGSFLAIPMEVRDWLAPDQWQGLENLYAGGRLATDGHLFERLDRQMVHEPEAFATLDLDRHRLSLGDADYTRFAGAQKAIAEGRIDPDLARYDRLRLGIDRELEALDIDADGSEAADARADARDRLKSFEAIEGRPPNGEDIDRIVGDIVGRIAPVGGPVEAPLPAVGDAFDPRHVVPAQAGGRPPPFRPPVSPPPRQQPAPGPNQPPAQVPGATPGRPSPLAPQPPQGTPPAPGTAGPAAAEQAAAEKRTATYDTYRAHLRELDPGNPLLKSESVPGAAPDRNTVESYEREVTKVVKAKIEAALKDLTSRGAVEQRSEVRTISDGTNLRTEFDKLRVSGKRVYTARGEYREGGSGELYALPGSEGIRVGFRMATDIRKGTPKSIPTLEVIFPGETKPIKFHYNTER